MGSIDENPVFGFSASKLPLQLFINNEYVDAKKHRDHHSLQSQGDSLVSDKVPVAGAEDVDAAFAHLLDKNIMALAELRRITLGAPYGTFGKLETGMAAESFRYNAGWIDKFAGEAHPQEDGFMKITRHEPLGVTAGIVPWNAPLGTVGLKAAPALATGNCFILKPSKTPFAALALGLLIKEAGFPPGVFQVLSDAGPTGAPLARHMRIRKVSFTGSIGTGKLIQKMAAESNLKRVTLDLGETNTGQVCFAASRVYVQEGIVDKFTEKYKAALEERAKSINDPEEPTTLMGPLVDEAQFRRVTGFIERGAQHGAILTGGKRVGEKKYFIQPTVFTNVASVAELYKEEIFGPVSILNSFKTEDEVLQEANATEYRLMAGVFTQDINKAMRMASNFDSGMVGTNCVSLSMLNIPFGGSKQSGLGRECGRAALEHFTEPKTIMMNLTY
ncbi:uncharacterized protein N7477_001772 [Penicillium maclennaniae]|uniref:uncharacterized protein n=1 Tax=Penicillium maclennaniae TaxID=1343394 RepID=UPI00253FCCC6|nr:uncharacterized protein N7477_001772 [Penicillium maclennaniae]KAJ5681832.1 hypothetical protein N7477_001772 [Penicillium maclennaniae]